MRLRLWRKRRLPTTRYQRYWHGEDCYIQVETLWTPNGHLVVRFRPYEDYIAETRLA